MNDLIINIEKSTRMVILTKTTIGNDFENLQEKLIFKFTNEFVDGQGRLEYKIGSTKNYIVLLKENNTYTIPVKNILTKEGKIEMQLVITEGTDEENIPVFKSNVFWLYCNKSINAVDEAPSSYELWIEQANAKLNAMDSALEQVDNLNIDASKTGNTATIEITNKNGLTKEVQIFDGEKGENGQDGIDGLTPTIGNNGNWYLGDVDTGKPSRGIQGEQGIQGIQGEQGIQGIAGNGITSITKTSTSGNVDTYTILFTNNTTTTFQITNGDDYVLTNADKQEIASLVLEAADDGDEVNY